MSKRQEITPELAAAERARREKARRHLLAFSTYCYPWYKPGRHHELVAEKLEAVERYIRTGGAEGIGRLMVMMPPRHGKTEQVSKHFPAWLLGKLPDSQVILTSYGADLAQDSSREVRKLVMSEKYAAVFGQQSSVDAPVELSEDSRARANWDLADPHRGGVVAAGVGGGITGKGAHLLVIDDPFKNREQAESEVYRKGVMSWYGSSAYTRLERGGAVVIMHTRWHREDLSGALLKAMATDPLADQWEVVALPAVAGEEEEYSADMERRMQALLEGIWMDERDPLGRKSGEALWVEKYNEDALKRVKVNLESMGNLGDWWSLYQQQPRPSEGGFFDAKDFGLVEIGKVTGMGLTWYRGVDLALGEKQKSDWNATAAVAMDEEGNLYIRDMMRVHEWNEFKERMIAVMQSDEERGVIWGIENVAFQSLAWQELVRNKKLANVAIIRVRPEGDKVQRARPVQTRAKGGKVFLVRGAWVQQFILEAVDFPSGKHDDQVDSVALGVQMIAKRTRKRKAVNSYQG
jgi:predicted phage terminase large subunit-like protein